LLFQIGKEKYAIDARQLVEVLPFVNCKSMPRHSAGVAGCFNYHGSSVPLIDLKELTSGEASQAKMSTRILITHYLDKSNQQNIIGFLAESVTETLRCAENDFADSGIRDAGTGYLGPVTIRSGAIIQRIELSHLLPESLRDQLFN